MNLERLTFKELTSIAQYWRDRAKEINITTDRKEFESSIKELTRIDDEIKKRSKDIEIYKTNEKRGKLLVIRCYYYTTAAVFIFIIGFILGCVL